MIILPLVSFIDVYPLYSPSLVGVTQSEFFQSCHDVQQRKHIAFTEGLNDHRSNRSNYKYTVDQARNQGGGHLGHFPPPKFSNFDIFAETFKE